MKWLRQICCLALLSTGTVEADPPATKTASEDPYDRMSFAIGWGIGDVNTDSDLRRGIALTLQLGQPLLPTLHIVEELHGTLAVARFDRQEPSYSDVLVAVGVRWLPLDPQPHPNPSRYLRWHRYLALRYLSLKLTGGLYMREVTDHQANTRELLIGPALGLGIGYLPFQGDSWAVGIEAKPYGSYARGDIHYGYQLLVLMEAFK
jgi:hypothetical protein